MSIRTPELVLLDLDGTLVDSMPDLANSINKTLVAFSIAKDVRIIIAGDTLPKKKPDPLPILHAASFFKTDPKKLLS